MKYGLYHLVVIDNINSCKGVYAAMCKVLDLNYDILANHNHQMLTGEHCNRFF